MASIYLDVLDFLAEARLAFGRFGAPPEPADQVALWKRAVPTDGRALTAGEAQRTCIHIAPYSFNDHRNILLNLTRLSVVLGRMAVSGDRYCAAWVFRDMSLLAYRRERRLHSYSHCPRFHVALMPLKRTMPGDEAADLATLLASSGDPLHDRGRGPIAPVKLRHLTQAIAWMSDDPRLREGATLVVSCRVDDLREPQPSRVFLRTRDGAEARLSERDFELIGVVLDQFDPVGHSWMPCGSWQNRRSCQTARPRHLYVRLPDGGISGSERAAARRYLLDWIEEIGGEPALKLDV